MPNTKQERVRTYRVSHPYHGAQLVSLINPKDADEIALTVIEAARRWGVQWGKILQDCNVEKLGENLQCTCGICKEKFIAVTAQAECPVCIEKRRKSVREYMKRHPTDRRVNAGK